MRVRRKGAFEAMRSVLDFPSAALPWDALGLLLAVRTARRAGKSEEQTPDGDCGTEGMCIGMCLGTAIGVALGKNPDVGASLGMLIGLVFGSGAQRGNPGRGND